MVTKKNGQTPMKSDKVRKATGAATSKPGHLPKTGLNAFALDISEASGKAALGALVSERSTFMGFAAPAAKPKKMDPESAALAHLDQALESSSIKKFARPKIETVASEFKSLGVEAMPLTGTAVVKFRQYFNKIPVYGSLVTVELDKSNECLAINSSLGTPAGVNHIATVSPADALKVAAQASGQALKSLGQTPRLYYYFDQNAEKWRLAYVIEDVPKHKPKHKPKMLENGRMESPVMDYIVDAHTGKLLAELPRVNAMAAVQEAAKDALKRKRKFTVEETGNGRRQMFDSILNVKTYSFEYKDPWTQPELLPGMIYEKPPTPWPLEAIGAHANASAVAKFLKSVVKRNNIDNKGGEMTSTVNCWVRGTSPIAKEWVNAYWDPEIKQMVYGQIKFPDGSFFSIASMQDVVAHEMFHGVTDYTSRLEYRYQSGAINESYSDIFGIILANFRKSRSKWKWEIGTGFDGPGTALRNMADPALQGQPKHMQDYYNTNSDNGGVHTNSGIHNYAAYNIMVAKSGSKYLFSTRELAGIFYIALTVHLSRTSQFSDSRRAVVQATRSLFRNQSAASLAIKVKAIEDGFDAAGIS